MFDPNGVRGPGIEILRDSLAEQESRLAKHHEAAKLAAPKRSHFEQAGKHIPGKFAAWGVGASVVASVGGAEVGIDLVVRRREIELSKAVERIRREKHSVLCRGFLWCRGFGLLGS